VIALNPEGWRKRNPVTPVEKMVWNVYQTRGFSVCKKKCQMVEPVDDRWAILRPSKPG
jgi:hypothetical protein